METVSASSVTRLRRTRPQSASAGAPSRAVHDTACRPTATRSTTSVVAVSVAAVALPAPDAETGAVARTRLVVDDVLVVVTRQAEQGLRSRCRAPAPPEQSVSSGVGADLRVGRPRPRRARSRCGAARSMRRRCCGRAPRPAPGWPRSAHPSSGIMMIEEMASTARVSIERHASSGRRRGGAGAASWLPDQASGFRLTTESWVSPSSTVSSIVMRLGAPSGDRTGRRRRGR